ncbi:unnamed protein product, partial [Alternaria alternata]
MFAAARQSALRTARTQLRQSQPTVVPQYSAFARVFLRTMRHSLVENIRRVDAHRVVAGHSAFGKNIMPCVSALLDTQQISDITDIEGEDTFVRPIYAGNAIMTVQSSDGAKGITVRGTAFPAPETEGGNATVEEGIDPKAECSTEWISEGTSRSPTVQTLARQRKLSREVVQMRSVRLSVHQEQQSTVALQTTVYKFGQTGKNVAPQLYLCAGISGVSNIWQAWKDSKVIAAINKDAEAPIFQVADVGLVGDLFEKVPELDREAQVA